jgi:nucleoside-diphosphate-sugar epimerase
MRFLFVGGTGLISSAVSPLVVERGHHLTLVNRGTSAKGSGPDSAHHITADIHDVAALRAALAQDVAANGRYDAVVQWIAFSPDHVSTDIETFKDITDQYVFISSASAYETPPSHYIVREDTTPLSNPHWGYSRDKAEGERRLLEAHAATGFPATIVRPSHTYGYSDIPMAITSWVKPWTVIDRLLTGKRILLHGDGTSLWTVTDHRDFAVGIAGLLGNPAAIGEAFHITGDDVLTWNQIHGYVADAIGISRDRLAELTTYIPTDVLVRFDADAFEGPLLGDKTNAGIFDTSKLRALVPDFATNHHFKDSVHESVAWFQADESRRGLDADANALWDGVLARWDRGIAAMFD